MAHDIIKLVTAELAFEDITVEWCKKISDNANVSQAGMTLTPRGSGIYKISNPNITVDTDYRVFETATPANAAVGIFSPADGDIARQTALAAHETARSDMETELTAEHDATQAAVAALSSLIADIDTSTELEARFTELKGDGWSVESLKALYDLINATALVGSRVTTIQLYETGGTTPIADADISVFNDDLSLYMGRRKTDANGQLAIGRDDGTYKLVPQKAGWTFNPPLTLTVAGSATHTYYGDTVVIPQPGDAEECILYVDLISIENEYSEGVVFTVTLKTAPKAVSGKLIDPTSREYKTDANGHKEITLVKGCKYTVDSKALPQGIDIDTTDQTSINIAQKI